MTFRARPFIRQTLSAEVHFKLKSMKATDLTEKHSEMHSFSKITVNTTNGQKEVWHSSSKWFCFVDFLEVCIKVSAYKQHRGVTRKTIKFGRRDSISMSCRSAKLQQGSQNFMHRGPLDELKKLPRTSQHAPLPNNATLPLTCA